MPRSEQILEGYLEQVSGEIMEHYREIIGDMIRGRSGVYALYQREKLQYVGLATNLMGRIRSHLRDRHRGTWDRFSVYLTARSDQPHVRELEALLLRILVPKGNRVSGRLGHALNLSRDLHAAMANRDARRRADLVGGPASRRLRRKQLATGKRGADALQGIVTRRVVVQGVHKDTTYRGVLRVDGQVRFGGELYESATAAARAAVGRSINGWWFWRMRHGGEWVRLSDLRKRMR